MDEIKNKWHMLKIFFRLLLYFTLISSVQAFEVCNWNNQKGIPCITISKTSNSSLYNSQGINKKIFTKQDIIDSGASTTIDLIKKVSGIDYIKLVKRDNRLVFLWEAQVKSYSCVVKWYCINDQSATNGLHDFGQDFIQTIQQIEFIRDRTEHFGPDAIGGAINFVTDIDYINSHSLSGFNFNNNSVDYNITKITKNDWHLNFNGVANQSKTDSAIAKGNESDGTKNYQLNFNGNKWLNDSLKFKSMFYYRDTKSAYDSSATKEESVTSDNKMYAFQTGFEKKKKSFDNLMFHYHNYDRNIMCRVRKINIIVNH